MMLVYSAVMFAVGLFGSMLLLFASYEIAKRFGRRGTPVMVEIGALIFDRIVLNICMFVCLMLECATLIWDTIFRTQFPIWLRWPLDTLVVAGVFMSGIRLFRLYLQVDRREKPSSASST